MNRNCLSYWFPKLQAAGVPVPRTEIVRTEVNLLLAYFGEEQDGPRPIAAARAFCAELIGAADRIDEVGPWFLRTGQGSGKHNWKNCCHLVDLAKIERHVAALVEWSECVDMLGLPWNVWCVRELLPVRPVAVLPRYGNMPLVPEVRAFVRDGRVICSHDYWPADSIVQGGGTGEHVAASATTPEQRKQAHAIARRVAEAFDGAWSVDLLPTDRGWFVTDMAEADRSFHWPGCPNGKVT